MFLNLKLVQVRGNMFGQIIARDFTDRPAEVLQMIRDQYKADPDKIIETISPENAIALGLINPLERFKKYFPAKRYSVGVRGLIYDFKSLREVFDFLTRAKSMIAEMGLNLEARSYSKGNVHKLFIDEI